MKINIFNEDCFEVLKRIPDNSVELVLTDPPYGITASRWDKPLNAERLWKELNRITTERGTVILFGAEPFASSMRISVPRVPRGKNGLKYKYDIYWNKHSSAGFVHVKYMPIKTMEVLMVFSKGGCSRRCTPGTWMTYNPQGTESCDEYHRMGNKGDLDSNDNSYRGENINNPVHADTKNFPKTYVEYSIKVKKDDPTLKGAIGDWHHPTRKPIALLEYIILTYSNKGETVLDFTMGSGSTGVACVKTERDFIGVEIDKKYFDISEKRLEIAKQAFIKE